MSADGHLILLPCLLTLKLHILGLKITEIWNFPLIVTCINQSVLWPTNLVLKKKKKNYVAINQTCVLLIRKTGFSIFLIKYFYHLEDTNYISWFGRDKPEKKSGLTFTLSISWFLCFIVYIFYILLLTL